MGRNGFSAALLLLVFIVGDVSKASMVSKHRYLIGEPPKDNTTSKLPGKDSPAPSVVPPLSSSSNNRSDPNDATNNKTGSGSAKTPKLDQVGGSNNGTDKGFVSPSIDIGDGKNQTQKQKKEPNPMPAPAPEKKPEKKPKKKPKENPAPVAEKKKPKEEAEKKPKEEAVSAGPPPPPKDVKAKSLDVDGTKSKDDDNVDNAKNVKKESCDGAIKTCSNGDVVACIKSFDSESKEAVILVQNIGNSTLKGHVSAENTEGLNISKLQNKKVKLKMGESNEILVKAGTGDCVLRMDPPVSEGNFFMRLPSYEKVLTPINGAYFLIVAVLIFGGTCACCMVKKRKQRTGGGVPYQELEMALPESASATEVVTADGWDEGWDDDWDGDNAVKSPGGHLVGSISANGLTARSSNKDGWENNWDD